MSQATQIDHERLIADLSRLSFREIDPERSLNIDQGIDGDETWSVFTRICEGYGIGEELFWSKLDYHRYFLSEFDPILFVWGWLRYFFGPRVEAKDPEPFMIDDLLDILSACREAQAKVKGGLPGGRHPE